MLQIKEAAEDDLADAEENVERCAAQAAQPGAIGSLGVVQERLSEAQEAAATLKTQLDQASTAFDAKRQELVQEHFRQELAQELGGEDGDGATGGERCAWRKCRPAAEPRRRRKGSFIRRRAPPRGGRSCPLVAP